MGFRDLLGTLGLVRILAVAIVIKLAVVFVEVVFGPLATFVFALVLAAVAVR